MTFNLTRHFQDGPGVVISSILLGKSLLNTYVLVKVSFYQCYQLYLLIYLWKWIKQSFCSSNSRNKIQSFAKNTTSFKINFSNERVFYLLKFVPLGRCLIYYDKWEFGPTWTFLLKKPRMISVTSLLVVQSQNSSFDRLIH